jgi:hypothetical protein
MNKQSYSQILDRVARDHMAEHIDLAPRILTSIEKGKLRTMQPRRKIFVTIIVVLLVLMIVAISVPAVRAAIQRWVGYVPGVGLISEGQIRVLEKPASMTQDEITVKVEQVLIDSNQTTVLISIKGLKTDMIDDHPGEDPRCYQSPVLRLPAAELPITGQTVSIDTSSYQLRVSYASLAPTINEATLVMPCIPAALPEKTPGNWEISFHLIPAPPQLTALPLIEIPTPAQATPTTLARLDPGVALKTDGIFLTLDRAVQLKNGYLIYATMHWENSGLSGLSVMGRDNPRLLDASGQEISYSLDSEAMISMPYTQGQTVLAIQTGALQSPGPLTVVVDRVNVIVGVDARFTFDPGPAPKPGQVWELDQEVDLGYGYSLRVVRATYQNGRFSFDMESNTGVKDALLVDMAHPVTISEGISSGRTSGKFDAAFSYEGTLPEGPITVNVLSIAVDLSGPWEAQWTPPLSKEQLTAHSQSPACLRRESWERALQQAPALPSELGGTLALFEPLYPGYHDLSIVKLDGRDRKLIDHGYASSFSPDGTRVIYIHTKPEGGGDGLYVTELASGETMRLPGTTGDDMNPLWSPDGQQIVFTHRPVPEVIDGPWQSDIMMIDVGNWNVHKLVTGFENNIARAWMPDGNHILYVAETQTGSMLQIIDLQTGESSPLFETRDVVRISPDGTRLVFGEMVSSDRYSLFVSDLDGSNRKRLTDGYPYHASDPVWSPNGKWIIVSIMDIREEIIDHPVTPLALIQVDPCQIIPLSNLNGYVSSWLP